MIQVLTIRFVGPLRLGHLARLATADMHLADKGQGHVQHLNSNEETVSTWHDGRQAGRALHAARRQPHRGASWQRPEGVLQQEHVRHRRLCRSACGKPPPVATGNHLF